MIYFSGKFTAPSLHRLTLPVSDTNLPIEYWWSAGRPLCSRGWGADASLWPWDIAPDTTLSSSPFPESSQPYEDIALKRNKHQIWFALPEPAKSHSQLAAGIWSIYQIKQIRQSCSKIWLGKWSWRCSRNSICSLLVIDEITRT